MRDQTPEEIRNERDVLQEIVSSAQERERIANLILQLLVAAGHVEQKRVDQARALAERTPS